MKRNKVFFTLTALLFCVFANAQKEIPDSTEVLFDDNGSFTRVINTPEEVNAKLIVAATMSGLTAKLISNLRPKSLKFAKINIFFVGLV